jgi:UDP-N-acetyl-D-mannosaminuronate dehydrogenase
MKILYSTKIGFIGLGKLGMPCAEAIVDKGFDVTGYDIVPKSSDKIRSNKRSRNWSRTGT